MLLNSVYHLLAAVLRVQPARRIRMRTTSTERCRRQILHAVFVLPQLSCQPCYLLVIQHQHVPTQQVGTVQISRSTCMSQQQINVLQILNKCCMLVARSRADRHVALNIEV